MEYKDGWDRWRDEMEDGGNGKRDRIEKRELKWGRLLMANGLLDWQNSLFKTSE